MSDINTEVIRRAQQGEADQIAELYKTYHVKIFRYLYYRVGDRQTAEDLTSEVFVRMLRFLGSFKPPSASFQAWLFQIARNICNDHFRKLKSHQVVPLEEEVKDGGLSVHDTAERILNSAQLKQALNQLSEDQRDVIIMRFIADMSIAEAAHSLNKTEDSIKGLQRRALLSLKEILKDWEVSYVKSG
jgi:RNA polymerase sigma-70 factor, ECF subfamily